MSCNVDCQPGYLAEDSVAAVTDIGDLCKKNFSLCTLRKGDTVIGHIKLPQVVFLQCL